jgi:hypothetical protein
MPIITASEGQQEDPNHLAGIELRGDEYVNGKNHEGDDVNNVDSEDDRHAIGGGDCVMI